MFQNLALNAFIKMLCIAMCKFFDFCICDDDCPDGVCDDAFKALEDLDEGTVNPVSSPAKVKAIDFNIDWTKLQPLVASFVTFINDLKAFLGLNKVA